jgi:hypothetical protein
MTHVYDFLVINNQPLALRITAIPLETLEVSSDPNRLRQQTLELSS